MRFLADMGISAGVVGWLRGNGHDATHLRDEGLKTLADTSIFDKAIKEDRIVLTFDLDFSEIAAISGGRLTSVVIFRLRNTRTANVIARLSRVLQDAQDDLKAASVISVEDSRHRIRRLPIGR